MRRLPSISAENEEKALCVPLESVILAHVPSVNMAAGGSEFMTSTADGHQGGDWDVLALLLGNCDVMHHYI